jgi:hypothetical protein
MPPQQVLSVRVGARTTELPRARAIVRDALRILRRSEDHIIDVSIVLTELLQAAAEEIGGRGEVELRLEATVSGTRIELRDHLPSIVALGGRHHALRSDVLAALTSAQGSFATVDGSSVVWAEVPVSRLSATRAW